MYSVRRSRNAACACRFLCFRSSEVAYIYHRISDRPGNTDGSTDRFSATFSLLHLGGSLRRILIILRVGIIGEILFFEGFNLRNLRRIIHA